MDNNEQNKLCLQIESNKKKESKRKHLIQSDIGLNLLIFKDNKTSTNATSSWLNNSSF